MKYPQKFLEWPVPSPVFNVQLEGWERDALAYPMMWYLIY